MAIISDFSFEGAKVKVLKPGDILFKEKSIAKEMFFIESGTLTMTKQVLDKTIELGEVSEGEFLSERAILCDGKPRTATAEARTECEVIVIGEKQCKECYDELPAFIQKMVARMARRLAETNELVAKLIQTQARLSELTQEMQVLENSMLDSIEHHRAA